MFTTQHDRPFRLILYWKRVSLDNYVWIMHDFNIMVRIVYLVACGVSYALMIISLSFAFEQRAYAYVDPGSALLLVQLIGATGAGLLFAFNRRLRALFRRRPSSDPGKSEPQGSEPKNNK